MGGESRMKKWKLLLAAGVLVFACMGCGAQGKENASQAEVKAESEQTESQAAEKNDAAADLKEKTESGDSAAFAEQIKTAMADKDMEALAELCAYPLAVNGEVIDSEEAFLQLSSDDIFTEERCEAIEVVDVSALEETMAGVVMGEATPNIIFKSVDGKLGITGIN